MKKQTLLLITLVMSSPAFASTAALHAPVKLVSCDPGSCFTETGSGDDLTQGVAGYGRQVQRVMKQVDEIGSVDAVSLSAWGR
ncbi:hypothetical protein Q3V30_01215 [Erwinia pyri]|uniref:Uncharacterized protein n=1 Tax=Erwinia pyri TaxID=3062598 RepID=A0AA50DJZ6_9GAMM|nr:hypothetical protein [Erwinia sp. DE2]WLS79167.1 hypothetical protein Q3V30_01215 [Erwinia sp. DE2]